MLKGEFEFPLEDKIEYAVGGDTKIALNLTIKAPSFNDTKNVLKLHSLIQAGMSNARKVLPQREDVDQKKEDSEETSEAAAIAALVIIGGCDTDQIVDIFTQILIKSSKLDGIQPVDSFLLKKLSPRNFLKLLGEYYVNFPLAV